MGMKSVKQYELILSIMQKIIDCEGGNIVQRETANGGIHLKLNSEIPYEHWCEDCKKRLRAKIKLMTRWAIPTYVIVGEDVDAKV